MVSYIYAWLSFFVCLIITNTSQILSEHKILFVCKTLLLVLNVLHFVFLELIFFWLWRTFFFRFRYLGWNNFHHNNNIPSVFFFGFHSFLVVITITVGECAAFSPLLGCGIYTLIGVDFPWKRGQLYYLLWFSSWCSQGLNLYLFSIEGRVIRIYVCLCICLEVNSTCSCGDISSDQK